MVMDAGTRMNKLRGTDWTDASDVEDSCIQSDGGTKGDDSMSLSTWAIIIGILIAVIIAALVIAVRWKLNEDDEVRPSKKKVDSKKKVEKKELTADDIFAELDDDDIAEASDDDVDDWDDDSSTLDDDDSWLDDDVGDSAADLDEGESLPDLFDDDDDDDFEIDPEDALPDMNDLLDDDDDLFD